MARRPLGDRSATARRLPRRGQCLGIKKALQSPTSKRDPGFIPEAGWLGWGRARPRDTRCDGAVTGR